MNVPTWVYEIWHGKARQPGALRTLSGDGDLLDKVIKKTGCTEETIKAAWFDFIMDEGIVWFTSAPLVAVKRKFNDGNEKIQSAEDDSQITKFPFRAFLSVAEGYIVKVLA